MAFSEYMNCTLIDYVFNVTTTTITEMTKTYEIHDMKNKNSLLMNKTVSLWVTLCWEHAEIWTGQNKSSIIWYEVLQITDRGKNSWVDIFWEKSKTENEFSPRPQDLSTLDLQHYFQTNINLFKGWCDPAKLLPHYFQTSLNLF